ncbi:hypothetical protein ACIRU8_39730 [Streptomyces sp. NPDC101175]|uniref:hypothetical protein n=1 Tax=Streptomyces sp. NPDC101175 TaxID=3366123 RepID=UPI003833F148
MAGSGPQKYPGASTAYWWQSTWGGDLMEVNVAVLHTTEGTSLPNYSGGAMAPNLTAVANFAKQRLDWYQHFDIDRSSRALQNLSGGVETNTLNVVQVEFEGTCDYAKRERWGSLIAGKDYIYWGDPPAWALRDAAGFLKWLNANHGVPLTGPATWLTYGPDSRRPGVTPASYGASPARMSFTAWNSFKGVCGHQHVPENDHGDPGSLPFAQLIALAKGQNTPPEGDVALTADDIEKVAAATVNKLIAGGGVLENSDLSRVWAADVIPAARPPYNNSDYYGSDGKTPNNTTWTAGYTQQTQVEGIRETLARVKNVEAAAGSVDLTDTQVAALAAQVAAAPGLADAIAAKVADLLAARLAE